MRMCVVVVCAAVMAGGFCALSGGADRGPASSQAGDLFPQVVGTRMGTPEQDKVVKFDKSQASQEAAELNAARKQFAQMAKTYKVRTTEIATEHFVLFTDAPAEEQAFLKKSVEEAYAATSKQLGAADGAAWYMGKMPVYVWSTHEPLARGSEEFDAINLPESVPGYHVMTSDGTGHVAMTLEGVKAGDDDPGRRGFVHVLRRECFGAFLGRWRTSRSLPIWLERGLGELVAEEEHPDVAAKKVAQDVLAAKGSIRGAFTDADPQGDWIPVLETVVEMMAAKDPKAMLEMCKALKDGARPADAVKRWYGWDFGGLERAWREYVEK